ncbi:MAG: hypothetical protein M1820_008113 [Bogoriella megaspora]|nr:MAG: hypothetical protein M1820_008113 [Bogoriella megaspora]
MSINKVNADTHSIITPAILYWGTPVVLISTLNPDSSTNISPMSSAWWLGHRCMIGLNSTSQTTLNLLRTKECVLNLPSDTMAPAVNALARTTGRPDVPAHKTSWGYRHEPNKFTCANLTPQESDLVSPQRILECPVQMEAKLIYSHEMMQDLPDRKGAIYAFEVSILRTHIREELRMEGFENRVDPDKWRPMFMSFQQLYGLADRKVESELAKIEEEGYRAFTRSEVVKQGGDMDTVG